jgi:hypothetical protein
MFVRRSIAGIVLLLGSSIAPAQADSTASVTFSGYVAPACMVMTIDDDRLIPRDDRSSVNTTSARELRTADAVTIVP